MFILVPSLPLKIVYGTTKGINYIRAMSIVCLLYYFQAPLSSSLQAMGKAKDSMNGTIIGVVCRLVILAIGCNLKIGLWGLVISTSINIIVVTIYDYIKVRKYLKKT